MKTFIRNLKLLTLSAVLIFTFQSKAAEPVNVDVDVNEIVNKTNLASYYPADDGRAQARMIIVDSNGNKQMRQFTILRKDQQDLGDQDILVFFSRPTDVKGTVFRVVKHAGKKIADDDDRWLYLPALDLVKRISAGDKRTSFVGGHFFYEDVSGRDPNEDNFILLYDQKSSTPKGSDKNNSDKQFYTLKAQPKNINSVEFSYYIAKIDKQTFLPMQVTYFNQQNKKMREMKVLKTKEVNGFTTVMHSRITAFSGNGTENGYSEMQFKNVKYNLNLPDSLFTERSLRNPPKKWLK